MHLSARLPAAGRIKRGQSAAIINGCLSPEPRLQACRPCVGHCSITASRSSFRPMRTAPLASVWCWYKVGSKDERARADRRVALGRAHELQGHDQHPPGPGEGHHRAVRRQLERLHLDRSDDLSRDGHRQCARPHALHRGRAHGERPLSPRRFRIRADRHHLGAARAARTIPSSCSTPRSPPPPSRRTATTTRPSAG